MYYDRDGKEVTRQEWAAVFDDMEYRVVGKDQRGDVEVSTVWLGLDYGFGRSGPPIIYETMIFGGPHDQYQRRYATLEEAEQGHKEAVKLALGHSWWRIR